MRQPLPTACGDASTIVVVAYHSRYWFAPLVTDISVRRQSETAIRTAQVAGSA
jgi:hypothetical protein